MNNNKQVKNNGMKNFINGRVFILSFLLALCSSVSLLAEPFIDVRLTNRVFTGNASSGTLTYDVELRAGPGYRLNGVDDGDWTGLAIRIDIYGQPGFTFSIPAPGEPTTHDMASMNVPSTAVTYGLYNTVSSPAGVTHTLGVIAARNASLANTAADLGSAWIRIATISMGVTGGDPIGTLFKVRTSSDGYEPIRNAFWSNTWSALPGIRLPLNQWYYTTPDRITIADTTICYNTAASLTAKLTPHTMPDSITGPVFRWYSAATGGTLLHTGPTYTPPTNLTATTTYHVSVSGNNHFESTPRKPVTVTVVSPLTSGSIAASQTIPHNTAPAALTGGTPGGGGNGPGSYSWQSSPNGSTWANIAGTGAGYAPGVLTTTTYYRRGYTNNCGTVYTTPVIITVGSACTPATAAMITASPATICAGETATLNASTITVPSPIFRWYSSQTSTTVLETGPSYTTPVLSVGSITYYVSVEGAGYCENATGARKEVTVTVNPRTTPDMIKITVN